MKKNKKQISVKIEVRRPGIYNVSTWYIPKMENQTFAEFCRAVTAQLVKMWRSNER